jgi:hypothetical protein
VFLASDEAEIITGIDIPVDAGLRHKYPTWMPGAHTGVNIRDFAEKTYVTRYGEPQEKLVPGSFPQDVRRDPSRQEK